MAENRKASPYVEYLERIRGDRGALAALRRGLGQPPGAAPEMFPYVVPWLPSGCSQHTESVYYLLASLYAAHPGSASAGNIGDHLRAAVSAGANESATERRFVAMLSSHIDDLPVHLRHIISFLRSKEQPVNWSQLLEDLLHWSHPARIVQKAWARSFWSNASQAEDSAPETN